MADNSQSRTARKNQQKQSKKQNKKPMVRRVLMTILLVGIIGAIGVGGLFAYYVSGAPSLNEEKLSNPLSAKIYDKDDELFADLGSQKRTKISYEEIPQVLEDAVIATEDARFREHIGIDFRRILAAVYANITEGFGSQGASTITQQVVKNAFLSPEKSIERKVQEQWLAIRLEQQYSKDQILTMYLNTIYYGNNAYGVSKAAEIYFNKDLNELKLPEAALLAGLPQRPVGYDPFEAPDLAQERKNIVLDLMVEHNKISQEKAEKAQNVKITSMIEQGNPDTNIPYDAFLEKVIKEVKQKMEGADIYKDGLKVYTTLDQNAQKKVEELLGPNSPIPFPDNKFQTGLTVLDTKSGAIRAIGGGRNKENINDSWNYAIQGIGRQPGSTFKPIVDYGPAIEFKKWSTYHQLNDEPYQFQTGDNNDVNNWDNRYMGWMTMREALARSRNVPAAKTLMEVGIDQAQSFAEGLGVSFQNDPMYEANAIGGATHITPLELASAYSAFGNEGVHNEPYSVRKVEFQGDRNPVEFETKSQVAMKDYTAYMITDMLKDVVKSPAGTGQAANVSGLPLAGKTGTTNTESGGTRDSWFAGYTTNYTISVWSGYKEGAIKQGKDIPQQIFRQVMSHISQGVETADFKQPSSVVRVGVEAGTNPAKLPSDFTPSNQINYELFVKGTAPSKTSQAYDKLDPVQGLTSQYDKEKGTLTLSWSYNQDESKPVVFTVSGGAQGGEKQTIVSNTENTKAEISNLEKGKTYTFDVVAISETNSENKSDPASVQVQIPEEQDPDDILDGIGEDEDNEDNQNNGENDDNEDQEGSNNNNDNNQNNDSDNNDDDSSNNNQTNDGSTDGSTDESTDQEDQNSSNENNQNDTSNDGETDQSDDS
ncbi:PBP1A family penicillin-binding protein [Pontibacillus yanchengensis]|uniref:PBP1A family penicillin-binding protein n=2 Tax=Pontibacillus yanchengensis TaxID=462910 RepID=A0A6I4ZYE2_9BACI|nr:PBP1A family penicillin-binding protein [Pontibacillus yanchengensis]MYL32783.1 PBP1A family penicillin-binding protein [Pontibacillus yanchengensis]MYL55177.1 PBP1A family penicillin-binding protein [Pontibacillus yanchengensis]